MNKEELAYLLALERIENVGDKTIEKIYNEFGSFEAAWNADASKIKNLNTNSITLSALLKGRNSINIEKIIEDIEEMILMGIKIGDRFTGVDYPPRLYELSDAPSVIYIKGEIKEIDREAIAIVGTRNPSSRGENIAKETAEKLSEADFTIVSGLARGIDTAAHLGALSAKGRTIAVLGTGFSEKAFYPRENFSLLQKIAENGCALSEYPPNSMGLGYKFYLRNRIISVLSKAVIIIEVKNKEGSGTLKQARYARNQGRKVFLLRSVDRESLGNIGWRNLKREIRPLIVDDIEEIIQEIRIPSIKQEKLFRYGASIAEY